MSELFQITLILITNMLVILLSQKINLPVVVGQLMIGIILGPALLNVVHQSHTIDFLAELGVILLMFLAGMESDLKLLKKYFKPAITVAISGVLVPLISFILIGNIMDYQLPTSIFYGLVFAATSVSITVEVLQEYNYVKTSAGSVILGAAVVDDILAVLLVSIFSASTGTGKNNLVVIIITQLVFMFFLYLVVKYIPRIFDRLNSLQLPKKYTNFALLLCLVLSLLADYAGMSAVIGSFFAGLAISQTKYVQEIESNINLIAYSFFIPIFFTSISLPLSFKGFGTNLPIILILSIIAVLTKILPAYVSSRAFKFSKNESFTIGSGMVSRGEMALIISQIGLEAKLISTTLYSELVIVIIITTIIAPLLLKISLKKQ